MTFWSIIGLIMAGALAGFINTLAGSGTLITLPMLIFLGLPPTVANGTNRIAILLQTMVASASFRQQRVFKIREAWPLAIPAFLGSFLGANVASVLNEELFHYIIAGLLIVMFFIILYKPKTWIKGRSEKTAQLPKYLQMIIFFGVGLYGGFIHAGVGLFMLAGLVLGSGYDLVKANALKVFIVFFYTLMAVGVFASNNQINWTYGLIMSVGNISGALLATRFAVSWGPRVVRKILLVVIVIAAAKLLGAF